MQFFPVDLPRPGAEPNRKLLRRSAPERLRIAPVAEASAQPHAKHPPPVKQNKGGRIRLPFRRPQMQMA